MSIIPEYTFFYDESFHDRKIVQTKKIRGKMNIQSENTSYHFVSVFVGVKTQHLKLMEDKITIFEAEVREIFKLKDSNTIKGTIIGKKWFRFGINSFNKNAIKFYNSFFTIFGKNILFQSTILNKFEIVITKIMKGSHFKKEVHIDRFVKLLVFILNIYKTEKLISIIFDNNSTKKEFLDEVNIILTSINTNDTKGNEKIRELKKILNESYIEVNVSTKYEWDYDLIFTTFSSYLEELKIEEKQIILNVDNEVNTIGSAKNIGFSEVVSIINDASQGVRVADIMSNFIGRFIKAIDDHQSEYTEKLNETRKVGHNRRLSKDWFDLCKEKYELYQKISEVFLQNDADHKFQTGYYEGLATSFLSLIYYITIDYKTFNEFSKISPEKHSIYYARCSR